MTVDGKIRQYVVLKTASMGDRSRASIEKLLHDSLGPNGLARFDRDVLAQTGVAHVIVQVGANDIFTLNPAEEVTAETAPHNLEPTRMGAATPL